MGRGRNKNDDENEETIKELKAANKRLKSDNERLKAELATLQEAFSKTSVYLKGNTDGISVEKIIEGVKKGSTLAQIKKSNVCKECGAGGVKELQVGGVGKIILCSNCKNRKVIKNVKEEKER